MEVTLVCDLAHYTGLLEQVIIDVCSDRLSLRVEVDFKILAESRRVVVPQRLCVSERFE